MYCILHVVVLIFRDCISLSWHITPKSKISACLHATQKGQDRLEILLVCCSPGGSLDFLTALTKVILKMVLDTPCTLVLGDSNVHAKVPETAVVQDFLVTMAT